MGFVRFSKRRKEKQLSVVSYRLSVIHDLTTDY